jgi:hypothetical protein
MSATASCSLTNESDKIPMLEFDQLEFDILDLSESLGNWVADG